jgi:hypothetical protein
MGRKRNANSEQGSPMSSHELQLAAEMCTTYVQQCGLQGLAPHLEAT